MPLDRIVSLRVSASGPMAISIDPVRHQQERLGRAFADIARAIIQTRNGWKPRDTGHALSFFARSRSGANILCDCFACVSWRAWRKAKTATYDELRSASR